ncbi:porin family protein [Hymenobacter sp. GOD-10R]|uniref:porin family protein n=1 Tax=Hymenobacter sp. GOD-10R TaxID=3093922 RepID=UPI002D787E38|nr:porin family protein [Hymenobacter sp. GOD-10R]WRQ31862.1 porin family protein [Hymenobacter sp. GOD-10R]
MACSPRLFVLLVFWLWQPTLGAAQRLLTGLSIGRTWASARYPDRAGVLAQNSRGGLQAGVAALITWGHLGLQSGVRYTQLGDQLRGKFPGSSNSDYRETRRLNYLQVPLLGLYSLRADGQGLHLVAGPYGARLVGGYYQEELIGNPKIYTWPVTQGGRWDVGLQVGVGYRFRGLLAQAGYDWGLHARRVPDVLDVRHGAAGRSYNRAWHLGLSYVCD